MLQLAFFLCVLTVRLDQSIYEVISHTQAYIGIQEFIFLTAAFILFLFFVFNPILYFLIFKTHSTFVIMYQHL